LNSFVVKAVRLLNSLVEANSDRMMIKYMCNNIHTKYLINHLTLGFLDFVRKIPNFTRIFKIFERSIQTEFNDQLN